jgi:hypothetical protein
MIIGLLLASLSMLIFCLELTIAILPALEFSLPRIFVDGIDGSLRASRGILFPDERELRGYLPGVDPDLESLISLLNGFKKDPRVEKVQAMML